MPLEPPAARSPLNVEFRVYPNQLDNHRNSFEAEKLSKFIKSFWEINKKIPTGRQMCEALNFETRQAVYALLLKMREGSPLIARRKHPKEKLIGASDELEYIHVHAWRDRFYLRYRSLKLVRDFAKCYRVRSSKPSLFSSLSRKVSSCPQ